MFDTNDGGQLPPEGREDITLHIAQTTSMSGGGYMDLENPKCANVLTVGPVPEVASQMTTCHGGMMTDL